MITISLCMIVKNEEKNLARCLHNLADLMDEIIIVDTGSTDKTEEIARKYTDKVYHFAWTNDFSAARNFAFSKANMEYIYSADADEIISEANKIRFCELKQTLLPEIEIVQMKYSNQLEHGTIYNFDEEYRPKLFKRVRTFLWENPVHEKVRTFPVVYESDIVITHRAEKNHGKRDLTIFHKYTMNGGAMSKRMHNLYARELFISGTKRDFMHACDYFSKAAEETGRSMEEIRESLLVLARADKYLDNTENFFKHISKLLVLEGCSETCYELADYYEKIQDYTEAVLWYYNAVYETEPVLKKSTGDTDSLKGLIRCYRMLNEPKIVKLFKEELKKNES